MKIYITIYNIIIKIENSHQVTIERLPVWGKNLNHGHHNIPEQYKRNWHQFQIRRTILRLEDDQVLCVYYILAMHVCCNKKKTSRNILLERN